MALHHSIKTGRIISSLALIAIGAVGWHTWNLYSGETEANSFSTKVLPGTPQPAKLRHFIQPLAPQRALVVALAPSFLSNQPTAVNTYLNVFRIAAQYLDIIVIVPQGHPEIQAKISRLLAQNPADETVRKRIRFIPAVNSTIWVRDYLPQYALSKTGGLVMIDSGRMDLSRDPQLPMDLLSTSGSTLNSDAPGQDRQRSFGDGVTPRYLASHLRSVYRYPLQYVRSPLVIDGGDFILTGTQELLISEATLRLNGGDEESFTQSVKEFYGLKKVHFLQTLPGNTIEHLDLITLAAPNNTLLIATPPVPSSTPQRYDALLVEQITAALSENRAYLAQQLPKTKLISVPMPPLMSTPRETVISDIRQEILHQLCLNYTINWDDLTNRAEDDPIQLATQHRLEQRLINEYGQPDLENEQDLDRLARQVLGESLKDLIEDHAQKTVAYRTYLNATVLNNREGRSAVIIPRYKPRTEHEAQLFPALEAEVIAAYREAFPTSDLHWLDCDSIVGYFGAVHCITHTVPDWEAIQQQAAK